MHNPNWREEPFLNEKGPCPYCGRDPVVLLDGSKQAGNISCPSCKIYWNVVPGKEKA
jgi:transcription elongation factor Elf1